jgi:hypothetical protein
MARAATVLPEELFSALRIRSKLRSIASDKGERWNDDAELCA